MIYIGLPQWSHPKWVRLGITSLEEYARHFNCVEGNTTLYALPKPEVVLRWREQTTDDFRFCFKFPATISHQAALRHCDDLVTEFLTRMSPLAPRIGQYWLQLPATFGPRELPALWHFLDSLPGEFNYGVEVRHPQFFAKGEEEQTLNRGLHQRGVNRVILDSRPVHAARPHSEAIRYAQRKKPKVPVHAVLTAKNPLIRFIGSDDMTQNRELFQVWLQKLAQWHQTTTPYLFLHTPDIAQARNWYIPCGKTYVKRFQRSEQFRLFHSNLLFSEFATYHRQVPSAILKGVCMVSALYAVLSALLLMKFSFDVVRLRMQYRVAYGDGGFSELQSAIRIHGNAVEYIPIAIVLMLFMEMNGAETWMVHICGIVLLAGRLMHYYGFHHRLFRWRRSGMSATWCALLLMVLANLWYMPWELVFSLR